jgi:hypothetical protein
MLLAVRFSLHYMSGWAVPRLLRRRLYQVASLVLGLSAGCAAITPPQGGPKDTTGPELLQTQPPHRTRNFDQSSVTFHFNEFLKPGSPKQAIFISPVLPSEAYSASVLNRRLTIEFKAELRDSTTYVITLGKGIKDYTEGNALKSPIQYAFSTGDELDTCRIYGQLRHARTGKPPKGFTVLLYQADSIQAYDFRDVEPAYAATPDEQGRYELGYLAGGNYRLLAIKDADNSYSYNLPNEAVAIPANKGIRLGDSVCELQRNLQAFQPDTLPPKLNNQKWRSPRDLALSFSEAMLSGQALLDTAAVDTSLPDSVRQPFTARDTLPLLPKQDDQLAEQRLPLPRRLPADSFRVRLAGVTDTAGNSMDTTLQLKAPPAKNFDMKLSFKAQEAVRDPYRQSFRLPSPLVADSLGRQIYVVDTAGKRVEQAAVTTEGYQLHVDLPARVDTLNQYSIVLDSTLTTRAGHRMDTLQVKPFPLKGLNQYGSLAGKIQAPDSLRGLVLHMVHQATGQHYTTSERRFLFSHLPTGQYQPELIVDRDGNGRWTPGQLTPFRRPEPVHRIDQPVEIRAGWSIEDYNITYPASQQQTP